MGCVLYTVGMKNVLFFIFIVAVIVFGYLYLTSIKSGPLPISTEPIIQETPTMHPSWDTDGDGLNDCELDGTCDHTIDYTQPKP